MPAVFFLDRANTFPVLQEKISDSILQYPAYAEKRDIGGIVSQMANDREVTSYPSIRLVLSMFIHTVIPAGALPRVRTSCCVVRFV